MVTTANIENIQENPERKSLYLNSVRVDIQEDLGFLVASALAGEITEKVAAGFTIKTYTTFWKRFMNDKWIYQLNYGRFY